MQRGRGAIRIRTACPSGVERWLAGWLAGFFCDVRSPTFPAEPFREPSTCRSCLSSDEDGPVAGSDPRNICMYAVLPRAILHTPGGFLYCAQRTVSPSGGELLNSILITPACRYCPVRFQPLLGRDCPPKPQQGRLCIFPGKELRLQVAQDI